MIDPKSRTSKQAGGAEEWAANDSLQPLQQVPQGEGHRCGHPWAPQGLLRRMRSPLFYEIHAEIPSGNI